MIDWILPRTSWWTHGDSLRFRNMLMCGYQCKTLFDLNFEASSCVATTAMLSRFLKGDSTYAPCTTLALRRNWITLNAFRSQWSFARAVRFVAERSNVAITARLARVYLYE